MNSTSSCEQHNARLGIILFTLYLLFYAGFVLINAFLADWMEAVVLWGLNLAVVYGFSLIIVAIILSGIYGWFCKVPPREITSDIADGSATETQA